MTAKVNKRLSPDGVLSKDGVGDGSFGFGDRGGSSSRAAPSQSGTSVVSGVIGMGFAAQNAAASEAGHHQGADAPDGDQRAPEAIIEPHLPVGSEHVESEASASIAFWSGADFESAETSADGDVHTVVVDDSVWSDVIIDVDEGTFPFVEPNDTVEPPSAVEIARAMKNDAIRSARESAWVVSEPSDEEIDLGVNVDDAVLPASQANSVSSGVSDTGSVPIVDGLTGPGAVLDVVTGDDGLLDTVLGEDGLLDDTLDTVLGDDGVVDTVLDVVTGDDGLLDTVLGEDGLLDETLDTVLGDDGVVDTVLDVVTGDDGLLDTVLGEDGLLDETLDTVLGDDGVVDTVLDVVTGDDGLLDTVLGEDGLLDETLDTVLGDDGVVDTVLDVVTGDDGLLDTVLGEDGLLDDTLDTVLGDDGVVDTVLDVVTGDDGLLDTVLGEDGLLDDTLDTALGDDGVVDTVLDVVTGDDGLLDTVLGEEWFDATLDTALGDDGVVDTVLDVVTGDDGLLDTVLGEDGLLDETLDTALGDDGVVDTVLDVVTGENGLLGGVTGSGGLLSGLLSGVGSNTAGIGQDDGLAEAVTASVEAEVGDSLGGTEADWEELRNPETNSVAPDASDDQKEQEDDGFLDTLLAADDDTGILTGLIGDEDVFGIDVAPMVEDEADDLFMGLGGTDDLGGSLVERGLLDDDSSFDAEVDDFLNQIIGSSVDGDVLAGGQNTFEVLIEDNTSDEVDELVEEAPDLLDDTVIDGAISTLFGAGDGDSGGGLLGGLFGSNEDDNG